MHNWTGFENQINCDHQSFRLDPQYPRSDKTNQFDFKF